ncbi:hypothetical protein B0H13DRAFT_2338948 [Mycena leptocephala]|nr:hypothetical protein B0H13DRAFT_2338948 [Mycena leptocephala]
MGLIGEQCTPCREAAEAPDGGGLAGRWWIGWASANNNSGYIGAIHYGFLRGCSRWLVRGLSRAFRAARPNLCALPILGGRLLSSAALSSSAPLLRCSPAAAAPDPARLFNETSRTTKRDASQLTFSAITQGTALAHWSSNFADGSHILTMYPDSEQAACLLVAVAAPLAGAFTIAVPTNPTSGEVTEINWTFTAKDPTTFSLFLTNSANAFDLKAIIAENLETDLGQIHTLLPTLPAVSA